MPMPWIGMVVLTALAAGAGRTDPPSPSQVADPGATAPAEDYRLGMELVSARPVEARRRLTDALLSGRLSGADQTAARKALTELADRTIFGPAVIDDDPYVFLHTFQPGQTVNQVVRSQALRVPPEFILKVNRISDASGIRAGQAVKFVHGPFCAVINKRSFTMDVYLRPEGLPRILVRQARVGLGRSAYSTPEGMFRLAEGGKAVKPPWDPPAWSKYTKIIRYGEKGYPFGRPGLWMRLEGDEPATKSLRGYALHTTSDPSSIGKASSHGCIRVGDRDMEFLYDAFAERWSTVEIKP